jgi:UDP-N-acetylglucosamine 2-epimerase
LLTVKFVEMAYWLPAAIEAAASQPDVQLVIKPHPAETAAVYAPFISGRRNVSLSTAVPGLDLASLIAAADGIVTMNSTVALDALVLGVPSLVVGIPSNLSPFVDAGLMLGADAPEKIGQRLRALLYDRTVRDQLATAADPFIRRYGLAPDGHAAERAATEILRMTQ